MWMDEELRELKERISAMSDEQLLNIVEVDFDDYRQEAIDFAKTELMARGISFKNAPSAAGSSSQENADAEESAGKLPPCSRCGAKTRLGVLLAESEITITFSDNDEQRFVEARACVKCGHVELVVDLATEVDEAPGARVL